MLYSISAVRTLISDIVSGAVLQPVMDLLADPDVINLILELSFDKDPAKVFPRPSGRMVVFLERFTTSFEKKPPSVSVCSLKKKACKQISEVAFVSFRSCTWISLSF